MKTIHVELADKGCVIVVFEHFGNQGFRKFILIKYDEGFPIVRPANEVGVFAILKKAKTG